MVWLIRVLIIGTFSIAGDNLFSMADGRASSGTPLLPAAQHSPAHHESAPHPADCFLASSPSASNAYTPAPKPAPSAPAYTPGEPTYHNLSFDASSSEGVQPRKQ